MSVISLTNRWTQKASTISKYHSLLLVGVERHVFRQMSVGSELPVINGFLKFDFEG